MATWPFRSASPSESMRAVSVTSPAPMTTPRIPNRGRVETSDGITAAVAWAITSGVGGRVVIVAAAMILQLAFGTDRGNYRKTWSQVGGQAGVIQPDLYRNALHNLGEVAGSIVGWQQRKLRSAGRSNFDDSAMDNLSGEFVDADLGRIANFDIG